MEANVILKSITYLICRTIFVFKIKQFETMLISNPFYWCASLRSPSKGLTLPWGAVSASASGQLREMPLHIRFSI